MPFGECKVYNDSSHYIAIPYKPNNAVRHPKPPEEKITVIEEPTGETVGSEVSDAEVICEQQEEKPKAVESVEAVEVSANNIESKPKVEKKMTRKELFEQLYDETKNMALKERKAFIKDKMLPYFRGKFEASEFVEIQFDGKKRNMICRRVRLTRKVNLAEFNYFCTFTYDNAKHTEESFRKSLKQLLRNMTYRKSWQYAGVWERSPTSGRLHFHGLFDIPKGTLPGTFEEIQDYNTTKHKRQTTKVNSYFLERFGRNDFKDIDSKMALGESVAYLTKYMEKTGEKIVYSKNLPQYFISDIMDEDIVCTIGQEDRKLLLFDDFGCWNEGCYMGTVSTEVIKQMRKVN